MVGQLDPTGSDLFLAAQRRTVGCLGWPMTTKQESVVWSVSQSWHNYVGHLTWQLSVVTVATTVWVKKNPRWGYLNFSFFQKWLRIFNRFFTHLLHIPICARLQIFTQWRSYAILIATTYTVFRKKTHSHFLPYLHEWCLDLNKNCSKYT